MTPVKVQCVLLKIAGLTGALLEDVPEPGDREWRGYVEGFEQLRAWAVDGARMAAQLKGEGGHD